MCAWVHACLHSAHACACVCVGTVMVSGAARPFSYCARQLFASSARCSALCRHSAACSVAASHLCRQSETVADSSYTYARPICHEAWVCARMHVYAHACVRSCVHACMHARMHACVHACMRACACAHVSVCVRLLCVTACACVRVCVLHAHAHICMCTCAHVRVRPCMRAWVRALRCVQVCVGACIASCASVRGCGRVACKHVCMRVSMYACVCADVGLYRDL